MFKGFINWILGCVYIVPVRSALCVSDGLTNPLIHLNRHSWQTHTYICTHIHTHGINSHLCSSHSNSDGPPYPLNCLRNWIALGRLWLWLSKNHITDRLSAIFTPLCFSSLLLAVCVLYVETFGVQKVISWLRENPRSYFTVTFLW